MSYPSYNVEDDDAAYMRYVAEVEKRERLAAAAQKSNYDEPDDEEYYRWVAEQEKKNNISEAPKKSSVVPGLNYDTKDVKIVSLGITNHVTPSPRDEQIRNRMEKTDKFRKFEQQMAADRDRVIEETRRPYVRHIDNSQPENFVIGKPIDVATLHQQKRNSQEEYKRQLQADSHRKPIEGDRKKAVSKYTNESNSDRQSLPGMSAQFGRDEEYERLLKRRAAIELQERNNYEANRERDPRDREWEGDSRYAASPPRRNESPKRALGGRGGFSGERTDSIRRIEDAEYRYIGEQETDAKARKRDAAVEYMRQLDQDKYGGNAPSTYNDTGRGGGGGNNDPYAASGAYRSYADPLYDAADTSQPPQRSNASNFGSINEKSGLSKQAQQAEYKRQLDLQKIQREECLRRENARYMDKMIR